MDLKHAVEIYWLKLSNSLSNNHLINAYIFLAHHAVPAVSVCSKSLHSKTLEINPVSLFYVSPLSSECINTSRYIWHTLPPKNNTSSTVWAGKKTPRRLVKFDHEADHTWGICKIPTKASMFACFVNTSSITMIEVMCVFLQDAWTCWPLKATSPSRRLSHSWPVPPSSSPNPVRSSVWSCLTSASTAALETLSRSAPHTHTKKHPHKSPTPPRVEDRKSRALLNPVSSLITTVPETGLRQHLRAKHPTTRSSLHWSHYPEQVVGREGFSSEAKAASYVTVSVRVGQSGNRHGREKTL